MSRSSMVVKWLPFDGSTIERGYLIATLHSPHVLEDLLCDVAAWAVGVQRLGCIKAEWAARILTPLQGTGLAIKPRAARYQCEKASLADPVSAGFSMEHAHPEKKCWIYHNVTSLGNGTGFSDGDWYAKIQPAPEGCTISLSAGSAGGSGGGDDGDGGTGSDGDVSSGVKQTTYIHSAPTPNGPFTLVPIDTPACDNPSPLVLRNQTVLLMCSRSIGVSRLSRRSNCSTSGLTHGGGCGTEYDNDAHWRLYSAPSPRGPWRHVAEVYPRSNRTSVTSEDPFMWEDPNGNLHVLSHTFPPNRDADQPSVTISLHGFARPAGLEWHWSANQPYGSTIEYDDGRAVHFATAERPKLVLDAVGNPTQLVNGLTSWQWPCNGCPDRGYTNVCNICKLTPGKDYTYTIMRQLGTAAAALEGTNHRINTSTEAVASIGTGPRTL
jgi:hypothetical protein